MTRKKYYYTLSDGTYVCMICKAIIVHKSGRPMIQINVFPHVTGKDSINDLDEGLRKEAMEHAKCALQRAARYFQN
jgi:hypothetical protein